MEPEDLLKLVDSSIDVDTFKITPNVEEAFIQEYEKYEKEKLDFIKDVLESYYPNLWDLHINTNVKNNTLKKYVENKTKGDLKEFLNTCPKQTVYTIYIHFPEITITNSRKHKHIIYDMYIKIELNYRFINSKIEYFPSYFSGWRASKTYEEYRSQYNHSHMVSFHHINSNTENFGKFCLGSTGLSTLCSLLNNRFNEDDFILLCQQLRDYLRWESVEGGPYQYMDNIKSYRSNTRSVRDIQTSQKHSIYQMFLKRDLSKIIPSVTNSGYSFLVSSTELSTNTELLKIIDEVTPESLKVFKDKITGRTYTFENGSTISVSEEIEKINKANKRIGFNFKGEFISFKVLPVKENVLDIHDNEKIPNPFITNYIIEKLKIELNKQLKYAKLSIVHE